MELWRPETKKLKSAIAPDMKWMATTVERTGKIYVWNVDRRTIWRTFDTTADAVSLDVNGDYLAAGLKGNGIAVWNLNNGQLLYRIEGNIDIASSLSIVPSKNLLVVRVGYVRRNSELQIYDLADGRLTSRYEIPSSTILIEPDPSGRSIFTGSERIPLVIADYRYNPFRSLPDR